MNDYDAPPADLYDGVEEEGQEVTKEVVAVRTAQQTAVRALVALPISHYVDLAMGQMEVKHEHGSPGLKTSIPSLNKLIGGMYGPGMLNIAAGKSGIAKTTWLAAEALEFAEQGAPVLWITMEDDGADTVNRVLANVSSGNVGQIREGFRDHEGSKQAIPQGLYDAADVVRAQPITVINEQANIVEIGFAIKKWKDGWGEGTAFGMVIIDQLSHILPDDPALFAAKLPRADPPPKPTDTEAKILGWRSGALKELARLFGVGVVLAAQLNDRIDEAGFPTLESIHGSRGVARPANSVLALHRPPRLPNPGAGPGEPKTLPNTTERMWIVCLKFRERATFALEVKWYGDHQRVGDVESQHGAPREAVPEMTDGQKVSLRALSGLRTIWDGHLVASGQAALDGTPLPAPPIVRRALGTFGAKWALPPAPPAADTVSSKQYPF